MNTLTITPVMQDIYQLQIKFITGGHHWIGLTSKVNDFYMLYDICILIDNNPNVVYTFNVEYALPRCEHSISVWPVCIYLSESCISQNNMSMHGL